MRQIPNIGSENNQIFRVKKDNGKQFDMTLLYKDRVKGWFISVEDENKTVNNIRIVSSGNILHQYRNLIDYGIACIVEDDQEPNFIDDFSSERAKLYLLSVSEVADFAEVVSGQATA